ncbi:MAG: hypothetical protein ACYTAN_07780 [Planctomycetota bacterium]|jgi:hypothetical protein
MVEADVAGAGDYPKAVGGAIAARLATLAGRAVPSTASKGGVPEEVQGEALPLDAVKARVGDLYGAILPASQGRFAEAAAYIKSAAANAPVGAREKLETVADGAAGEDKDLAMKNVRAGVILIYFSKALAAMNEGDRKSGMVLLRTGIEYFGGEAASAGDAAADGIRDTAGMLRMELDTLQRGKMDPDQGSDTILEMMDSVAAELIGSWTVE